MYNTVIRNTIRFVVLFLLQVLIFDNLRFGSFIHPYVYVLFIMMLPFETPQWKVMINAFLIGFVVDIFNGTPGLHAAATVFLAFVRPFVIGITTRKSDLEDKTEPSVSEMGLKWFIVYGLILLILHNLSLFMLEAFSIRLFGLVLLEVLCSVPISLVFIILIIYILKPVKNK